MRTDGASAVKAELCSVASHRGVYDEEIRVQMDLQVTDVRDLFPMVGRQVYIYPKSRWGMFVDWLLRT